MKLPTNVAIIVMAIGLSSCSETDMPSVKNTVTNSQSEKTEILNVAAYTQDNLHNSIKNEKVTYFNANDVDTINYSY
jgi:hypothetical protein